MPNPSTFSLPTGVLSKFGMPIERLCARAGVATSNAWVTRDFFRIWEAAKRVPTRAMPDFVVRIAARFNAEMRPFVPDLGYAKKTSNDKARRVLGWTPREPREAIVAAATSMIGRTR